MTETPYLTTTQVAELLGVHEQTVLRYFRDGVLPGRIIGKTWKTTRTALDAFVEGRTQAPTEPLQVRTPSYDTQPSPTLETKD